MKSFPRPATITSGPSVPVRWSENLVPTMVAAWPWHFGASEPADATGVVLIKLEMRTVAQTAARRTGTAIGASNDAPNVLVRRAASVPYL
jgi:hypothetical protein